MFKANGLKLASLILSILIPFFYLINNVNLLTSSLNRSNRRLNRSLNDTNDSLQRQNTTTNQTLNETIETKLNNGTLEFVDPSAITRVESLNPTNQPNNGQSTQPQLQETNQQSQSQPQPQPQPSNGRGIISR
jgi:hypothetical protein